MLLNKLNPENSSTNDSTGERMRSLSRLHERRVKCTRVWVAPWHSRAQSFTYIDPTVHVGYGSGDAHR